MLETRSGTNGGVDAGLNRRQYPLHKHTRAGTKVPCDRVWVGATERLRLNARGSGRVRDALSVGITGARRWHGVEHRRVVVRAPNASAAPQTSNLYMRLGLHRHRCRSRGTNRTHHLPLLCWQACACFLLALQRVGPASTSCPPASMASWRRPVRCCPP